MLKDIKKVGLFSSALALLLVSSTTVLALPAQATVHAQGGANASAGYSATTSNKPTTTTQGSSHAANGQANGQAHLVAAQLKACQNRENTINTIMARIDTRGQNQLALFSTIAARVEAFYTKQGKTVSNYTQLVAAITSAKTQATTDLNTLKTYSTFSCSANNPKGIVTAFQSYLKTEISDLQNYRTAVKNLIVAVASANGVTVSTSSQASTTQGGK